MSSKRDGVAEQKFAERATAEKERSLTVLLATVQSPRQAQLYRDNQSILPLLHYNHFTALCPGLAG